MLDDTLPDKLLRLLKGAAPFRAQASDLDAEGNFGADWLVFTGDRVLVLDGEKITVPGEKTQRIVCFSLGSPGRFLPIWAKDLFRNRS